MHHLTFRRLLGLLVLAVTLNALAFAHVNADRIVFGTDSPEYDLLARQINLDHGLALEANAPYLPSLWREPGSDADSADANDEECDRDVLAGEGEQR